MNILTRRRILILSVVTAVFSVCVFGFAGYNAGGVWQKTYFVNYGQTICEKVDKKLVPGRTYRLQVNNCTDSSMGGRIQVSQHGDIYNSIDKYARCGSEVTFKPYAKYAELYQVCAGYHGQKLVSKKTTGKESLQIIISVE